MITVDIDDKPYNVGYIAGVFDLFHIGHLNMFKRAKEQCKYLIVGVVSDEGGGVRLNKQAEPFVPFDERIEMVRSSKYVDEAVKLPLNFCGTRDMYKIYQPKNSYIWTWAVIHDFCFISRKAST